MKYNIMTLTDSYKVGHYGMYPKDTKAVYSYFESRKGAKFNATLFFGLQYLIKEYLLGVQVTRDKIDQAKALIDVHMGPGVFNLKGWEYILEELGGILPVKIMAVPEGSIIPTDNVLMTVVNTDPKCFWLTNYLETLLTHVWSSSTVATLSREVKILCKHYLDKNSDSLEGLDFMLHDFGFRGATTVESAGICGAGHIVNFMGTDTLRGIEYAMEYYDSDMCAHSVYATEHSIMTAEGISGEYIVVKNLIENYPTGILSVVIDSYDYEGFITNIANNYKQAILRRDGKFVFRPDSGEPITTTLRVFELLERVFGTTINSKGFKLLHPKVGVLWGDGIGYVGIRNILHALQNAGWAAENMVFGMGGGLHQKVDRDTQRFAFKCSAQKRNGVWFDVHKNPTDQSKKSKRGKQYLYKYVGSHGTAYRTTNVRNENLDNVLRPVFENGELVTEYTFQEVRDNAAIK